MVHGERLHSQAQSKIDSKGSGSTYARGHQNRYVEEVCEKVEEEYWKKDGLVEDVVEEILINVGGDSEELDKYLQCLQSESVSPVGEKPGCSRQLQLEHTR